MILGIDAGNYKVKICGEKGLMDFISTLGEAREINLNKFMVLMICILNIKVKQDSLDH
jgi:hypothetical protein